MNSPESQPQIKFHCPHCDTRIAADPNQAGESAPCPVCGGLLQVPQAHPVTAPSPDLPPQVVVEAECTTGQSADSFKQVSNAFCVIARESKVLAHCLFRRLQARWQIASTSGFARTATGAQRIFARISTLPPGVKKASLLVGAGLLILWLTLGTTSTSHSSHPQSSARNHDEATELAIKYMIGDGVIQNPLEAVRLLKIAAAKGSKDAQFHLGSAYALGRGVERDYAVANHWFQKASNQGHPEAQFQLAASYFHGLGVDQNNKKWIEWLMKSAENGCAEAQFAIGVAYDEGWELSKDEALATKYFLMSSEQNYAKAHYELGSRYSNGKGTPKNETLAVKYFLLSAEEGLVQAQSYVGAMYHGGWHGLSKDPAKGTQWYMRAAKQGSPDDQVTVGNCYAKGVGVEQSDVKAFGWYLAAAEQGNAYGQYYTGKCYNEGRGARKDSTMAVKYLKAAADQGFTGFGDNE